MNIQIDLKRYSYLKNYFALKYESADPLHLPKGHYIHRRLEMMLTNNSQCLRIYTDNFLEIKLPCFRTRNINSYNKLSINAEKHILQALRSEFFADFEEFATKHRELGNHMIVDTFITQYNVDASKFDMLVKHLQRRPEKKQKT